MLHVLEIEKDTRCVWIRVKAYSLSPGKVEVEESWVQG